MMIFRQAFLYEALRCLIKHSVHHRIKIYPVDKAISFPSAYPLDSDSSGG